MNIYLHIYVLHTYAITEESTFYIRRKRISKAAQSDEINHAERLNPKKRSCQRTRLHFDYNPRLAHKRHYVQLWHAIFERNTFNWITCLFVITLSLSLYIILLFVSSLLQTALEPLSFSGTNETTSCTFIPLRTLVQSHATSGHET